MADNFSEILALLAEQMRAADRDREETTRRFERLAEDAARDREDNLRRFERLTEVMVNGFGRLENKFDDLKQEVSGVKQELVGTNQRVDNLTDRVDILTDEQRITNRRLQATFDQTGQLTEQVSNVDLRLTRTEQIVPTNAELDARLREVENRLRNAS